MKVSVYSRKAIEALIAGGTFPQNVSVVSFYDSPSSNLPADYCPIDYSHTDAEVLLVALPDMDTLTADIFPIRSYSARCFRL